MKCTNKFGRQRYPLFWPELNHITLVKFVAIIFHFDDNQRCDMETYWCGTNRDPFLEGLGISRKKFLLWYSCLRVYDPGPVSINNSIL